MVASSVSFPSELRPIEACCRVEHSGFAYRQAADSPCQSQANPERLCAKQQSYIPKTTPNADVLTPLSNLNGSEATEAPGPRRDGLVGPPVPATSRRGLVGAHGLETPPNGREGVCRGGARRINVR